MIGDTVMYPAVRAAAERLDVDVALVHLGGARFPLTGPVRFTITAAGAVELDLGAGIARPPSAARSAARSAG